MNVLLLPSGVTAFTEYSIHLANALSKNINVFLPLRLYLRDEYAELIEPQVFVKWYDDNDRLSIKRFSYIHTILTLVNMVRPDIIHIQQGDIWISILLGKLNKSTIVTTIHDVVRHTGEQNILSNLIDLSIISATNKFITHGQSLRSDFAKLRDVLETNISVIPIGELSFARHLVNKPIIDDGLTILFFGRMKKYKGLDTLIKAIPIVLQYVPDAHFIIAGNGEELDRWHNFLISNLNISVYKGYLTNQQVGNMIQAATVVVLPYHQASQSGIVSVAYPFGKPVIATRVGALPEVVENGITGFLVPPSDPCALANAIIHILEDKDLCQKMGKAALIKSQIDMDWNNIAKLTLEVYKEAINTNNRSS